MCSLVGTAKLNGADPWAWLADGLARIADHPVSRLHELLSWNWHTDRCGQPPVVERCESTLAACPRSLATCPHPARSAACRKLKCRSYWLRTSAISSSRP